MRLLVTIAVALVASFLAGSMAGVLIADWMKGDESYVLVFIAIGPIAIVAAIVFLIAGMRQEPAQAINRAGRWLVGMLVLLMAVSSVMEFMLAPMDSIGWRGVQLMVAIFGSCIAVVIVQWCVFRLGSRRSPPPATLPRFGRQPQ